MADILYKDESYKIIGACMKVHAHFPSFPNSLSRMSGRGKWYSVSNAIKVLLFPGYNTLLETKNTNPFPTNSTGQAVRKRRVVRIKNSE